MIRRALVLALLASPAAAQDAAAFGAALGALKAPGESGVLAGAYAACLKGAGDPAAVAAILADAGWARSDDDEMGVTGFGPQGHEGAVYITLYDEGRICSVTSELLGTDAAKRQLEPLLAGLGLAATKAKTEDGCAALAVPGVLISQTSSGQDPVCEAATTSDIRFMFP